VRGGAGSADLGRVPELPGQHPVRVHPQGAVAAGEQRRVLDREKGDGFRRRNLDFRFRAPGGTGGKGRAASGSPGLHRRAGDRAPYPGRLCRGRLSPDRLHHGALLPSEPFSPSHGAVHERFHGRALCGAELVAPGDRGERRSHFRPGDQDLHGRHGTGRA